MNYLTRPAQHEITAAEDVVYAAPFSAQEQIKWERDRTPEALYVRIDEVATLFVRGKCTKALAVQRLLDLLYDINQLGNGNYDLQAKSRYYLLIFNYIYRIRSTRVRLPNVLQRKLIATDQTMYIGGISFAGLNLPRLNISNALFRNCDFSKASLQGLTAASCQFIQCRFDSSNLSQSEIRDSSFEGITFTDSDLSSSRILKSSLVGCDFSDIISSRGQYPLRVNASDLIACSFGGADLRGADFRKTRMTGCDTLDAKKQDSMGLT